jgi:SNF2 family DNA or RNA helicase
VVILHLSVYRDAYVLWGEAPPNSMGKQMRRRRSVKAVPLPFAADEQRVSEALAQVPTDFALSSDGAIDALVWLPTVDGLPLASNPVICEPSNSQEPPQLLPWQIPVWPLTPAQVVSLLITCGHSELVAPGVLSGADLRFWLSALRLTAALVAGHQALPSVEVGAGEFSAVWQPVLSGTNRMKLASLAAGMPGSVRALTPLKDTEPPQSTALVCLERFIAVLVDHLMRTDVMATSTGASLSATLPAAESPVTVTKPSAKSKRQSKTTSFTTLHDQWIHALRAPSGQLVGEMPELRTFAAKVRDWQRPIMELLAAPYRLCFRLLEPKPASDADEPTKRESHNADSETWQVQYLLQATDDPSLLAPASTVWNARGKGAALLNRAGIKAREYLLAALGQTARICPQVAATLRDAKPTGFRLSTPDAYDFLLTCVPVLEEAGFGVFLPTWWVRRHKRVGVLVKAKSPKLQSQTGLTLDSVIDFDWQVAIGDQIISLEELQALARMKSSLVRVRGEWVEVRQDELKAALAWWEHKQSQGLTVRETLHMALGTQTTGAGTVTELTATGWVGELLDQLKGQRSFALVDDPQGFRGTLRPYQQRGYSWLRFLQRYGLGACLADDMGLGKTVQTLALIQHNRVSGDQRPVLLICPTSVVGNWSKEAAKFTPDIPILVHHGATRYRSKSFVIEAQNTGIVISSYALLHRDVEDLSQIEWAGIILDEAQNIKNPNTKQAKVACSLKADYRIALTGTPVENHVGDLWSISEFLNPGLLGSQAAFKRDFQLPIQVNGDQEAAQRLKKITGPFILRRLKTDKTVISDLPEKLEMNVFCNLTKEQATLYTAVVNETLAQLESKVGIERRGLILATLMRLKQLCDHPTLYLSDNSSLAGRSGKLNRLVEMLDEVLQVGERALIFTQFAEMGHLLQQHLQQQFGRETLFLHGGVPKAKRDRMVERFQTEASGPSLFILSLKAGGVGLNLTRANHVFHYDRWWNPAVEDQATDRVFRIGQERNVQVRKFLCVGTLEEKINQIIERKKEVAQQVVGTGEAWLTELSTAELRDLLTLQQEAVAHE